MKIDRMTAVFGRLRGERLSPGPGLNIIYAPNEGGKSTWCAFLRSMLYGIDTRERDTKTSLADKNRYQPWTGEPMEGELALTWRGREIFLRRFSRGSVPFGGFSAVDAATGGGISELAAESAGETLLGVSRNVYERSAFITQGGIPFTGEQELEKRIAQLVSTGQEEVSFSATEGRLREWLRRRKYNRTGLVPRLENELDALDRSLERTRDTHMRAENARVELEMREREEQDLKAEQERHKKVAQYEIDRQYTQALCELEQAKKQEDERAEALDALLSQKAKESNPRFSGMTGEQAWQKASADAARVTRLRAAAGRGLFALILLGALFGGALFWLLRSGYIHTPALCAAALLPTAAGVLLFFRRRRQADELLGQYHALSPGEILIQGEKYRSEPARAEEIINQAQGALSDAALRRESAQRLLDTLARGGGRVLSETSSPPAPPRRSPAETQARLETVRAEIGHLTAELAMARGELNSMGDPAVLTARREEADEELARRKAEYAAITVALEELAAADGELQARFSPALNARTGEIMRELTGGRYENVTLTREFEASATERGATLPRRAMQLSQGTVDQLYLAVRLAVCELALPDDDPAPLVLDDALASFDQQRMERALELLRSMGARRQILLFTCHRREGRYLSGAGGVTHIDLQS